MVDPLITNIIVIENVNFEISECVVYAVPLLMLCSWHVSLAVHINAFADLRSLVTC